MNAQGKGRRNTGVARWYCMEKAFDHIIQVPGTGRRELSSDARREESDWIGDEAITDPVRACTRQVGPAERRRLQGARNPRACRHLRGCQTPAS